MPGYEKLRATIGRGFYIDNLRAITNLSLDILQSGPTNPAIFFTIAAISRWVADGWDDVGPPGIPVARVERQLKPYLERLVDAADTDAATASIALNQAAIAFKEAVKQGLDSDFI